MKVLIIGGSGFIGKNLREFLNSRTNLEVHSPTRNELNLLDDKACKVYLKDAKADLVIHSAVDILSVENTLRIFFNIYNSRGDYGHLIQLGSGAEYDKRTYIPKIPEENFGLSIPVDTYGVAKYLIGRELKSSAIKDVTNIRLFGIFGKYEDHTRRFISNNIYRVMAKLPASLNRDMLFDYIHVDDLGRLIVELTDKLPLSSIDYNFCSGNPRRLSEIASIIQAEMGQDCAVQIKNEGMNMEYSGSPKKLMNEIGDFKFSTLESSIKKLINFYLSNITKEQIKHFRESI